MKNTTPGSGGGGGARYKPVAASVKNTGFALGQTVILQGMTKSPSLNGRQGVVVGRIKQDKKGDMRYPVLFWRMRKNKNKPISELVRCTVDIKPLNLAVRNDGVLSWIKKYLVLCALYRSQPAKVPDFLERVKKLICTLFPVLFQQEAALLSKQELVKRFGAWLNCWGNAAKKLQAGEPVLLTSEVARQLAFFLADPVIMEKLLLPLARCQRIYQAIFNEKNSLLVPNVIHFIWFGEKPLPPRYAANIAHWLYLNPCYQIKLWVNSAFFSLRKEDKNYEKYGYVRQLQSYGVEIMNPLPFLQQSKNDGDSKVKYLAGLVEQLMLRKPVAASDILRILLLRSGGHYSDGDNYAFEPLPTTDLRLAPDLSVMLPVQPDGRGGADHNSYYLAAAQGSALIQVLIDRLFANLQDKSLDEIIAFKPTEVIDLHGPGIFGALEFDLHCYSLFLYPGYYRAFHHRCESEWTSWEEKRRMFQDTVRRSGVQGGSWEEQVAVFRAHEEIQDPNARQALAQPDLASVCGMFAKELPRLDYRKPVPEIAAQFK